jgi:DNA-binding CsgD family transcriptional regulator
MGKSALLEDLVDSAAVHGVRVLRTQGVESESPLAFAALHRLLRSLTRVLDMLPAVQARALRVALGQEEGTAVDPFLVGIATLSLLSEAGEDGALLCVVDDAHWLDAASADALLFAARRLEADRVAIVFAARDGGSSAFAPEGLETMQLGGLTPDAVRSLLADRVSDDLADEVVRRLLEETAGNPLALLALPVGLTAAQLNGTEALPAQLLLSEGVERVFLDHVRRLPQQVQSLMLVVAADDTGRLITTRLAATGLGVERAAWDEAERSGLLLLDGATVAVRHPLVRSAVYQAATSLDRRRTHQALAQALVESGDGDRSVWHRAIAAEGRDEGVGEDLAQVGSRAENRGAFAAAAAAYDRAAELTADEQVRAARRFAAARNAWGSGQAARAAHLASLAREQVLDPLLRADIDRLRGRIEVNAGSAPAAHRIFVEAARAVVDIDPVRALEMAVAETVMHNYGADSGATLDPDLIPVHARPDDPPRVRCLKQLLVAATLATRADWGAARRALDAALLTGRDVTDTDVLANLGNAALHLGDDQAARRFYLVMLSTAREAGAGMEVLYALQRLPFAHLVTGEWAEVRASAEEALALSRSVGARALTASPLAWLTLLSALQGRSDYDTLLTDLEDVVHGQPLGILTDPVHDLTRWARGAHAAHEGDPAAALHHLALLRLPQLRRMAATDRIEAAVKAGDPARAAAWVEELAPFAIATGWPWALGTLELGRALTADPAEAAALFEGSLAHHRNPSEGPGAESVAVGGAGSRPYDEARTHLAYGEWLRRNRRRLEARTHLRSALASFTDLGVEPLVTRATEELRASGESARKRDPSTLLDLTPMELKVARLVVTGLSNKDVAAQCWISPRTVAFHLRNVFAKTGVTSRGELARLPFG